MENFDSILKLLKLNQTLSNQLRFRSQISEIQATFIKPTLAAVDAITKSADWYPKSVIENPLLKVINSINEQHEKLFDSFQSSAETTKWFQSVIPKINSLQFALKDISGQIAGIAVSQNNRNLLEDFEEVTEKAIELSNNLIGKKKLLAVGEEEKQQFQKLLILITSFLNRNKKLGVVSLIVVDIFLRFAAFHQYYDFLQTKPELATKQDLVNTNIKQDKVIKYIHEISNHLKEANEYRKTNRSCRVWLKPKTKSLNIDTLPKNFQIIILQVYHEWIFASYFSPSDNLPQTGWILKKYLDTPR